MSQKLAIQTFLIGLAKDGEFYEVKYDPATGLPEPIIPGVAPKIQPGTVLVDETGASFEPDDKMGRRRARRRGSWTFQLILRFQTPALIEFFEQSLLDPAPNVPAEIGLPGAFLNLTSTSIQHPAQQGAAKGTEAILNIDVEYRRN